MKIWNDENADRKSSKIPWESISFLLPGDDILDVGFYLDIYI